MSKYIIRRSLGLIPLLLGIVLVSFTLMKLAPGGPQSQFNQNPRVTEAQIEAWLERWCLERNPTALSVVREFGGWIGVYNCKTDSFLSEQGGLNILPAALGGGDNGILKGDLGLSIVSGRPVTEVILERVPATLILTSVSLVIWVVLAVLLRRGGGGQALLAVRPGGDLPGLHLLLPADLLARPDVHLLLRRDPALGTRPGHRLATRLAAVQHAPVLGGVRCRAHRGHPGHRRAPDPAGDRARPRQHRG